ncbi:MAG TPA: hypothetical protein VND64_13945 [Pirellulales bacterium]|nr:hypothetical protein [Pirellulales bacterium]
MRNDVEILLRGGIRLSRSTWLNDHAPQIEVRGKADADIQVLIDETPATAGYDGQYTAAGWDSPGIHTVFCGGVTQSYELIDGLQDWDAFSAFSFARACGKGPDSVGICGPVVVPIATGQKVSLVPSGNTILLGATPGQFAELPQPFDLRAPERLAITGFQAVWAVPANPLRCRTSAGSIQFLPSSYRVEVEVKRRGSGKGRKNRKNKSIRQRPTELKFADAERFEDIYPDDLDRKDCVLLRERAVWRLECGRAILVGYRVFGRQGGPEPRVPGVTPRQALLRWCAAILDSSRRRLFFSPDEPDAKKLWRQHTRTARCLWKQLK